MRAYAIFVFTLIVTAVVAFGFDAVAGSKSHDGFLTTAEAKKCKKGYKYSETKRKCVRKGGYGRPDKS
jgi:hypothetical protein